MATLGEVVGSYDRLMGVKAVWGRSTEAVMCFGARDERYSLVRGVARRAVQTPFLITIGGGAKVPDALAGKVLELVKVTGAFGEMTAFVQSEWLRQRLAQWPVAIMASDVYAIEGEPNLEDDLGFSDRRILTNVFDGVKLDPVRMPALWKGLEDRLVRRRDEIKPPLDFADPGKPQHCVQTYPKRKLSIEEGAAILKEIIALERNKKIANLVKKINYERNSGFIVCEACDFGHKKQTLFDAHHLIPLMGGSRKSEPESFAVLCPTCHRWAHAFAADKYHPLSVAEIRAARALE